jgi:uncharacterized membrane protein YgcG
MIISCGCGRTRALKTFRLPWLVVLLLLVVVIPAQAQERSVYWQRWDVDILNVDTTLNQFDVRERYIVDFDGNFSFGSAVIPTTRLDSISNVQVSENGEPMRQSCNGSRGTYCIERSSDELSITYYFFQPAFNETRNFEIEYSVSGALRVYEGGDQLWWDAIPDEHFGFEIGSATVTVYLPEGFAPREGVDPVVTYGAAGEVDVNGSRVVATAVNGVGGYEAFSVRVQYPHDPNARVASWQADFDQQRAYEENVQPLVNIGAVIAALLIGIGGSLWVFLRYNTRGRDPQVAVVPEYLSEPPASLSPALVGVLLDERADLQDVISIVIDLAQREYLVIEETRQEGFLGIGSSSKFVFKRTDKPSDDLLPFENLFMNRLFSSGSDERSMDSLRNTFYTTVPQVQKALYQAVVDEGWFERSPEAVRSGWTMGGVILLVLAVFGFFASIGLSESVSSVLLCLPLALGLFGLVMTAFGSAMPAKTQKGAEEAAKWRAFREYMQRLERYDGVEAAASRFADFLPYAVAFGLNRQWVERFRNVPYTPIPPWYYPTYLGGPYGGGYRAGSPFPSSSASPGELARAGDGGFSLDDVSGRVSQGLDSISSGLTTMLDSAARVMTSQPQQSGSGSWSSGGRSFSGGGFSGGGGSGGGSRGFG